MYGGIVLAGYGFRTETAAHAEAQEVLGRPVLSLRLVDPRLYHLDMALGVLDDETIACMTEGALGAVFDRPLDGQPATVRAPFTFVSVTDGGIRAPPTVFMTGGVADSGASRPP